MKRFRNNKAEEIRLKALYRNAAIRGKLRGLPLDALKKLIGPDCAYHLYGTTGLKGTERKTDSSNEE